MLHAGWPRAPLNTVPLHAPRCSDPAAVVEPEQRLHRPRAALRLLPCGLPGKPAGAGVHGGWVRGVRWVGGIRWVSGLLGGAACAGRRCKRGLAGVAGRGLLGTSALSSTHQGGARTCLPRLQIFVIQGALPPSQPPATEEERAVPGLTGRWFTPEEARAATQVGSAAWR